MFLLRSDDVALSSSADTGMLSVIPGCADVFAPDTSFTACLTGL